MIICSTLLHSINELWYEIGSARMRELGIANSDIQLMRLLYEAGDSGLTLREVERKARLSQPTASRLVSTLHHRGLVEYVADKHDLRSKHAHLTENGRRVYRDMELFIEECERCALAGMTEDEMLTFARLLQLTFDNTKALRDSAVGK